MILINMMIKKQMIYLFTKFHQPYRIYMALPNLKTQAISSQELKTEYKYIW
jgi:hypothetical protein